jgi:hypothetical protein
VLQTWLLPNNNIRIYLLDMRLNWNKNAFWDVQNKKWRKSCNFISPYLFNKTYGLNVLTMDTNIPKQLFYVWLVDLQSICAKYGVETWFSPNDDIRKCLRDMENIWTKNAFWVVNNKKRRKWCKFVPPFLFNNTYG